jgi:hypothetical protein
VVFLLFAINGPALSVVGQLRYSELLILLVGLLNAGPVLRSIGKMEWRLSILFLLSALSYLVMDIVNQGIEASTVSRVGSYVILCALLFTVKWIVGDSKKLLVSALLGFSSSFIVVLILNLPVPSVHYNVVPWRLGLGFAVTLAVCTFILIFPKYYRLGLLCLACLLIIHASLNSRNLTVITLIVFLVGLSVQIFGRDTLSRQNSIRAMSVLAYGALTVIGLYALMQVAVTLSILPEEMQEKMEIQMMNPYGIFAAARPDVAAAIYGILQQPFTGFGSSTVDPEVFAFYASVSAASYIGMEDQIYLSTLDQEWSLGTPSHSHVFGAWVDAGVLAAVSWFAVLFFAVRVLGQVIRYRNPLTPLVILVSVALIWDVLFSPGPTRLSVALSLVVLLFARSHLARRNWRQ